MPPPEVLKKYNDILPGAAERIFSMAEKQSEHRRTLESKVIDSDIKRSKAGSIFAFVIGMTAILSGFILIYLDKDITGIFLGLGGLASLVSVFMVGFYQRKKERLEKYGKDVS